MYNLIVSLSHFSIFENRCSVLFQVLDSCVCKAIFGHVKLATAGPVVNTYFELKMFYFALESEKMAIMSGLQTLIFPLFSKQKMYIASSPFLFFFLFFFISIPKVKLIPQFINVIATNNDLLMDELNVI